MKRLTLAVLLTISSCLPMRAACALYNQVQWLNASGAPLNGGLVYSYTGGTTTPLVTYTSSTCGTPNANPAVMNAGGYVQLWLNTDLVYKFQIRTSAGVLIITLDGIQMGAGGGGGGGGGGAWQVSGNDQYNTNSGNVGIGNSTPIEKLTVGGNTMLTGGGALRLRNADTTPYYVGQQAPATGMAANYTVTWMTALPGMSGCVKMSTGGVLSVDSACSAAPTDTIWSQDVMTDNVTLADGMAAVSALLFKDQTAATGITAIVVQDGANQGSNYPLQFKDNAGTFLGGFYSGGYVTSGDIFITPDGTNQGIVSFAVSSVSRFALYDETDGSVLKVGRYDDAGMFLDNPIQVTRSSGLVTLGTMTVTDATCTGTCTGFGGGSSLPVIDTTSIVKGNVTASKQARFDVETLVSAGTTRSLTVQNASYVIAGTNIAQTISGVNTFTSNILASGTPNIGSTTNPFSSTFATAVFGETLKIATPGSIFAGASTFQQGTTEILTLLDTAGNIMQRWDKTIPKNSSLDADFVPFTNNTWTLGRGSPENRWKKLWVVDVDVSGTCTGCSGGGGGANTALSNLASVAINTNINPDIANARTSGGTNQWLTTRSNTYVSCDSASANCWQIQSVTSGTNAIQFNGPGGNRLSLGSNNSAFLGNSVGTLYPLLVVDTSGSPGINFYRSGSFKAGSISSGSSAALSIQDQSDNFRMVVFQGGDVEIGSTTDHGNNLDVHGVMNVTAGIKANGTFGATATYTVRNSAGSGTCTLTFSFGLLTSSTC